MYKYLLIFSLLIPTSLLTTNDLDAGLIFKNRRTPVVNYFRNHQPVRRLIKARPVRRIVRGVARASVRPVRAIRARVASVHGCSSCNATQSQLGALESNSSIAPCSRVEIMANGNVRQKTLPVMSNIFGNSSCSSGTCSSGNCSF